MNKPHKRKIYIKKISFILLGSLVLVIIGILVAAYIFAAIQKPLFVNKDLIFQNQLHIPTELQPRMEDDEKVFDLIVLQSETEFLHGKHTKTLSFNGNYLGPTIRVHTGDKIRMNVTNDLSEATTVHWHGMHLPASMDGGPHQSMKSAETWQPYWTVANEASTLWYHPHLMGTTGEQVYRGLAGIFIIDDENSDTLNIPKEYGVDDIPLIVQDKEFDQNGQFVYVQERADIFGHTGMLGNKILVNGTYAPYIELPAKQIRLRILNGSNARRYNFGLKTIARFTKSQPTVDFLSHRPLVLV